MLDRVTVITFAGTEIHKIIQKQFVENWGSYFGNCISYDLDWLKNQEFFHNSQHLFKYEKYCGYFLWKPWIIFDTLLKTNTEYVLYCDSNLIFKDIAGFERIFYPMMDENNIFLIKHVPWINKDWTKRDTFVYMDADKPRFWNAHQIWSVCMAFGKRYVTAHILEDYLRFCRDERLVTDNPNTCGLPNLDGFREHRWEQSVMSILAEEYRIPTVSDIEMFQYVDKFYPKDLLEYKKKYGNVS